MVLYVFEVSRKTLISGIYLAGVVMRSFNI